MATNAQKKYFGQTINEFGFRKTTDWDQRLGKNLPTQIQSVDPSGSIVTMNFAVNSPYTIPQVTMPIATPEYLRYPMQPNDPCIVVPSNARTGGISGLGTGTADLAQQSNLASMTCVPIGNKNNQPPTDAKAVEAYGPNGVVLKSKDGTLMVRVKVDGNRIYVDVPADGAHWIYLGGPGPDVVGIYSPVMTVAGPCLNVKGRIG